MEKLAVLVFVWALAFAMLFLPARKVGTWIARPPDGFVGTTLSILLCFVLAWSVVLLGWLALMVGGGEVFPHVKADYFGLSYVTVLLFVPAFAALITGYQHARMVAGRRTISSFLSANAKDLLTDLSLLAISVAFLNFGGRSLLRWYETGQIAARYRDVTYAAEPYLFSFEFFRSSLLVVLGLLGVSAFFVLRRYIRPRSQSQHREKRGAS
jgi:hypothetical protein